MKKQFVLGVLAATIFVACNKESDVKSVPNGEKGNLNVVAKADPPIEINSSNVSDNEPCGGDASDCVILPDITITANLVGSLISVGGGTNPTGVKNLFTSAQFATIVHLLPNRIKNDLQDGDHAILINYNGSNKINFCVGSEIPVTRNNQDYTVEFSK